MRILKHSWKTCWKHFLFTDEKCSSLCSAELKKKKKSQAVLNCRSLPTASFLSVLLLTPWSQGVLMGGKALSATCSVFTCQLRKSLFSRGVMDHPHPLDTTLCLTVFFPLLEAWQRGIPGHGKSSAAMEGKCWLLEIIPDGLEHLCCSWIF